MTFSLYYRKNKNEELFQALETSHLGLDKLQNYVPLYEKFFSLNASNYNSINLNQRFYLHTLIDDVNKNTIKACVTDNSDNRLHKDIFCKFSPLLDPLKYLTGKYDLSNNNDVMLPQFNTENSFPKLLDKNNTAYIDSFFTYLSSQLLHNYGLLNSIDYYGSFLGKQKKFVYNIVDDIDYLNDSEFFHENKGTYYSIDDDDHASIFNVDSRTNKKKLVISGTTNELVLDTFNNEDFTIFSSTQSNEIQIVDLSEVCIYDYPLKKSSSISSSSTYSSKSSNTSIDDDEEGEGEENNDDRRGMDNDNVNCVRNDSDGDGDSDGDSDGDGDSDDDTNCSSDEEEDVFCSIYNFPVQMITMEKCENTLDYLMEKDILDNKEWTSCLFQIIITLSVFQKTFSFTHNDLHTNNIMYIPTEKQFLYYSWNNITYKVPTYGKIYKIIDFGRSIYKFNGQIMCSDSFHPKGDAASQYNCEPYLDNKKPRLDPNPSFDLCRLACCLYDHFVEDLFDAEIILKKNKMARLISSWLIDDKGRNILYKNTGEERYPEFKLYKMIARTIHGAIPEQQIDNEIFKTYIVSKKKLGKHVKVMKLDRIPKLH